MNTIVDIIWKTKLDKKLKFYKNIYRNIAQNLV